MVAALPMERKSQSRSSARTGAGDRSIRLPATLRKLNDVPETLLATALSAR